MAGYFVDGVCYAIQQDAIDTYFQARQPVFFNAASSDIVFQYLRADDGSWSLVKKSVDNLGAVSDVYSINATNPVLGSCEVPNDPTSNFLLGMELGWAVAGVMITVFLIRRNYRGF